MRNRSSIPFGVLKGVKRASTGKSQRQRPASTDAGGDELAGAGVGGSAAGSASPAAGPAALGAGASRVELVGVGRSMGCCDLAGLEVTEGLPVESQSPGLLLH